MSASSIYLYSQLIKLLYSLLLLLLEVLLLPLIVHTTAPVPAPSTAYHHYHLCVLHLHCNNIWLVFHLSSTIYRLLIISPGGLCWFHTFLVPIHDSIIAGRVYNSNGLKATEITKKSPNSSRSITAVPITKPTFQSFNFFVLF